jgi:imidazolonepropionase-like amidohydrolase
MSEEIVAVKGGLLFDGTGAQPVEDGAVLVKGSKIADVGPSKEVNVPEGARVIDARGTTVLPGLMDLHVHIFQMIGAKNPLERFLIPPSLSLLYAAKHARDLLEAGFTTARDLVYPFPDYSGRDMVSLRKAIERGLVRGCRLFVAGVVTSTASHLDVIRPAPLREMCVTADGVDEVRKQTRACLAEEVDWIKTTSTGGMAGSMLNQPGYRNYTLEELEAIVDEAHSMGVRVASHSEGIVGCRSAVEAGIDTIEHASELDDDLIEEVLRKDLYVVPTMAPSHYRTDVLGLPSVYLPKELSGRSFYEVHLESQRRAHEAGIKMAMGTDCGYVFPPGKNAYELELYVRMIGMSPEEALLTATRNAADALGRLDDLGTIEEGKIADLVVVEGNPLEDIKILQNPSNIRVVMKEGKIEVDRR